MPLGMVICTTLVSSDSAVIERGAGLLGALASGITGDVIGEIFVEQEEKRREKAKYQPSEI
jgi:hypothetical protein